VDEQVVKTAVECALKAGTILLDYHQEVESLHIQSKGRFDYVTEADLAAQEAIIRLIRRRHPHHDILAEETTAVPRQSVNRWVVDPLDGTTNFIHGVPVFAVSIALEHEGTIGVAAVYDPCRKELFLAERGRKTTLNSRAIEVSIRQQPEEALVATAFPFRNKEILPRYLEGFTRVFTNASDIRRSGSAALDLAYVACGRFDGFWEIGLSPWDIAAGQLLVKEAGGRVSDFSGGGNHIWVGDIVAGNPPIHDFLLGIIQKVFGGNVSTSNVP
jgi:myo-inositol-1(or 4)-monophosphatase